MFLINKLLPHTSPVTYPLSEYIEMYYMGTFEHMEMYYMGTLDHMEMYYMETMEHR